MTKRYARIAGWRRAVADRHRYERGRRRKRQPRNAQLTKSTQTHLSEMSLANHATAATTQATADDPPASARTRSRDVPAMRRAHPHRPAVPRLRASLLLPRARK